MDNCNLFGIYYATNNLWLFLLCNKNNPMYKVLPIVTMGIPLTGLLAAIFLLGEKPTRTFIGGIIILVGVDLIVFNKNS